MKIPTFAMGGSRFGVLALALLLPACGSNNSPTSPTATATPAPQTISLGTGSLTGIQSGSTYAVVFSTTGTGTPNATISWTFPATSMQATFAPGNCITTDCGTPAPGQFVSSTPGTTTLALAASSALPAGTYSLLFVASAKQTEAISYSLSLVTG